MKEIMFYILLAVVGFVLLCSVTVWLPDLNTGKLSDKNTPPDLKVSRITYDGENYLVFEYGATRYNSNYSVSVVKEEKKP